VEHENVFVRVGADGTTGSAGSPDRDPIRVRVLSDLVDMHGEVVEDGDKGCKVAPVLCVVHRGTPERS